MDEDLAERIGLKGDSGGRLRLNPSDDDDGAEERGYLGDEELQMLAAVNVAQRVLADRDCEDAETRHVLDPGDLNAEYEFARASAALAEAKSAASAALAKWLNRTAQRKRQERFAGIVANRRRELGLSREQLSAACGLSSSTIRNLETPSGALREWNNKTKSAIEDVFSWPSGSFDDVLERGDSAPQARAYRTGPQTRAESLKVLRLEVSVYDAVEEVAILESRNINDVIDDAIDLYRRIKGPRSVGN
ncbi:MAG: helix-turn-helix transcriptional regulator [Candidatus Nanopelagicales bacterium]